ncbi:MAG: hypothetical protein AAF067_10550 [Pseudomonadota bacterium]
MRTLTAGLVLAVAALALWQWSGAGDDGGTSASVAGSEDRIRVSLMTSLPLVWAEGASMSDIIGGKSAPAPIFLHWQNRYDMRAVDSFEDLETSAQDVVILAQPRAMDPADLEVLDNWVRAGGRAVVLTDPVLAWHSEYPLGDNRRPLVTGLLSPLLNHWGLELLAPEDDGEGAVNLQMEGLMLVTSGIGTFRLKDDSNCGLSAGRILAECQIGKGRAILLADADFLNAELWETEYGSAASQLTDRLVAQVMQ